MQPEHDFSLFSGGPAYRLQVRLGLIRPDAPGLGLRIGLCLLATWIPLLIITALEGRAVGQGVRIPFLHDFHAYGLYLVGIPMLILAEGAIDRHLPRAAFHFVTSGLVATADVPAVELRLARARRWRDSSAVEALLLGLTVVSVVIASRQFPFDFSTWRQVVSGATISRTFAGWWDLVIGRALFQFLCWRWLFRILLWYGFLWRVSRLDLRLLPTHADRAAGLSFVGDAQRLFWGVAVALSATAAGAVADEVVYAGVPLPTYAVGIGGLVVLVLLVLLGPLLMFTPAMTDARIVALHEYGALTDRHHREFDTKWIRSGRAGRDPIVGSPDVSSLADLNCAYEVLSEMRPIPFDPADAMVLAGATLLPFAPLLLTIYPPAQVLDLLWKVVV